MPSWSLFDRQKKGCLGDTGLPLSTRLSNNNPDEGEDELSQTSFVTAKSEISSERDCEAPNLLPTDFVSLAGRESSPFAGGTIKTAHIPPVSDFFFERLNTPIGLQPRVSRSVSDKQIITPLGLQPRKSIKSIKELFGLKKQVTTTTRKNRQLKVATQKGKLFRDRFSSPEVCTFRDSENITIPKTPDLIIGSTLTAVGAAVARIQSPLVTSNKLYFSNIETRSNNSSSSSNCSEDDERENDRQTPLDYYDTFQAPYQKINTPEHTRQYLRQLYEKEHEAHRTAHVEHNNKFVGVSRTLLPPPSPSSAASSSVQEHGLVRYKSKEIFQTETALVLHATETRTNNTTNHILPAWSKTSLSEEEKPFKLPESNLQSLSLAKACLTNRPAHSKRKHDPDRSSTHFMLEDSLDADELAALMPPNESNVMANRNGCPLYDSTDYNYRCNENSPYDFSLLDGISKAVKTEKNLTDVCHWIETEECTDYLHCGQKRSMRFPVSCRNLSRVSSIGRDASFSSQDNLLYGCSDGWIQTLSKPCEDMHACNTDFLKIAQQEFLHDSLSSTDDFTNLQHKKMAPAFSRKAGFLKPSIESSSQQDEDEITGSLLLQRKFFNQHRAKERINHLIDVDNSSENLVFSRINHRAVKIPQVTQIPTQSQVESDQRDDLVDDKRVVVQTGNQQVSHGNNESLLVERTRENQSTVIEPKPKKVELNVEPQCPSNEEKDSSLLRRKYSNQSCVAFRQIQLRDLINRLQDNVSLVAEIEEACDDVYVSCPRYAMGTSFEGEEDELLLVRTRIAEEGLVSGFRTLTSKLMIIDVLRNLCHQDSLVLAPTTDEDADILEALQFVYELLQTAAVRNKDRERVYVLTKEAIIKLGLIQESYEPDHDFIAKTLPIPPKSNLATSYNVCNIDSQKRIIIITSSLLQKISWALHELHDMRSMQIDHKYLLDVRNICSRIKKCYYQLLSLRVSEIRSVIALFRESKTNFGEFTFLHNSPVRSSSLYVLPKAKSNKTLDSADFTGVSSIGFETTIKKISTSYQARISSLQNDERNHKSEVLNESLAQMNSLRIAASSSDLSSIQTQDIVTCNSESISNSRLKDQCDNYSQVLPISVSPISMSKLFAEDQNENLSNQLNLSAQAKQKSVPNVRDGRQREGFNRESRSREPTRPVFGSL